MHHLWKKGLALALIFCVSVSGVGCSGNKKDKKKEPAATEDVSSEKVTELPKVEAGGKGKDKSDVPLVVACDAFEKQFNPFSDKNKADQKAVNLTQLHLLTFDREGAVVKHAIQGEKRRFNGETFYYEGPANIKIRRDHDEDTTSYIITLRKDLTFSDGSPVTVDDVIFSMYAFADSSYQGAETFGQLPIIGLEKYRGTSGKDKGKSALDIDGIEKVTDYKVKVTVRGYDRDALTALNIPVCSLQFYGNKKEFNVLAGSFGFKKGDISSLVKKKNAPFGAGPYQYIKYEKGIVYYEANEKYYRGCPETAFVQLKEVAGSSDVQKLEALTNGDFDVVDMSASNSVIDIITEENSSGKLTGRVYGGKLWDGDYYHYIGMNAEKVCVDGKADSTRSKNMRKAFAVLFSCNRSNMVELGQKGAAVIDYPASQISWSVPQAEDEEYEQAYNKDVDGNVVYNSNMSVDERAKAACKVALGYLKKAGFKVKKGVITEIPENTRKKYIIYIPSDAQQQGMLTIARNARKLFKQLGLKLELKEGCSQKKLEKHLQQGTAQIWCGKAETSVNGDMYAMYHSHLQKDKTAGSRNYFRIQDSDLDDYIEDSMKAVKLKKSISLYAQSYDKILDWAVEVPVYQERNLTVFSTARVNLETVAQDISPYYDWMQDIQLVEMK